MVVDATVAEQAIRYPTDISLLNDAREISEQLIDELYSISCLTKKPRTYRQQARKRYLAIAKKRNPGIKLRRKEIREQLQYLRRNFRHIKKLQRRQDALERIPIEGKFGQGKNGYRLNYIRARTLKTSEAWINSIFQVMNLMVLLRFCLALLTGALKKAQQDVFDNLPTEARNPVGE